MSQNNIKDEDFYIKNVRTGMLLFTQVPSEFRTEAVCTAAIIRDVWNIRHINEPSVDLCRLAVNTDPSSIQFIKRPSESLCLLAVSNEGSCLQYIKNQTKDVCIAAINDNPWAFQYVKNQTDDISRHAISIMSNNIDFVKNQTEDLCLLAVQFAGENLILVRNQTLEICKAAIKQTPIAICWVDPDIYDYNSADILSAYMYIGFEGLDDLKSVFSKNVSSMMLKLPDKDLITAINVDLKSIFSDELFMDNCDELINIKQKALMLSSVSDLSSDQTAAKKSNFI